MKRVEKAEPYRVYTRSASFNKAIHPMLIEWSLAKDGAVTGLVVRPALADSAPEVRGGSSHLHLFSIHPPPSGTSRSTASSTTSPGCARHPEHQHLRLKPRDVPGSQVHRRDHQPPDQLVGPISAVSCALEVFSPSGPKSIQSL